jgi:2-hydroxycyclohexanecarboxyl-CoA dehydrogenase
MSSMLDLLSFKDRVAVVSGGAQGIGFAISRILGELGAAVVVADVDGGKAEEAAETLRGNGVDAWSFAVDIRSPEQTEALRASIEEKHGGLDVLVNAASIAGAGDVMGRFAKTERDKWLPLIDVNLTGTITITQALLPLMISRERGAIVNLVSDSYKGLDFGMAVYGAGKAGVAVFTKALSREVGPQGIRVNGVSPSATRTRSTEDMFASADEKLLKLYPMRRFGEPEDQAHAVVFLASDAAGWVTGQILSVNGGYN